MIMLCDLFQNHPDKQNPQEGCDTTNVFLEIENAWRILSDQRTRQEYDAELKGKYFIMYI